jgi:hypothetical protein
VADLVEDRSRPSPLRSRRGGNPTSGTGRRGPARAGIGGTVSKMPGSVNMTEGPLAGAAAGLDAWPALTDEVRAQVLALVRRGGPAAVGG